MTQLYMGPDFHQQHAIVTNQPNYNYPNLQQQPNMFGQSFFSQSNNYGDVNSAILPQQQSAQQSPFPPQIEAKLGIGPGAMQTAQLGGYTPGGAYGAKNQYQAGHFPTWQHGMFACLSDLDSMVRAFCCPCLSNGRVAQSIGWNGCVWCCITCMLPCIGVYLVRKGIKSTIGISVGDCGDVGDCFGSICCFQCAIAQQYRESDELGMLHTF